jgi:hypothetical protein
MITEKINSLKIKNTVLKKQSNRFSCTHSVFSRIVHGPISIVPVFYSELSISFRWNNEAIGIKSLTFTAIRFTLPT